LAERGYPDFFTVPRIQMDYREQRRVLQNDSGGIPPHSTADRKYINKIFPHGVRGYINAMTIVASNPAGADEDITFRFSSYVGGPEIFSVTLTVPAGAENSEITAPVRKPWSYDGAFVWCYSKGANVEVGYDVEAVDGCREVSWIKMQWERAGLGRMYIRLDVYAQTAGDIPVSGKVDVTVVPSTSVGVAETKYTIAPGGSVFLFEYTSGRLLLAFWRVESDADRDYITPRLSIDGADVFPVADFSLAKWHNLIGGDSKEGIFFGRYDTAGARYCLMVTLPLEFRYSLGVGAKNDDTVSSHTAYIKLIYIKLA